MKKILIAIFMVSILLISGCGSGSSSSTKTTIKSEPSTPKTEIILSSAVGEIEVKVSPSIGDKVKGIISVDVLSVPEETQLVGVALGKELGEEAEYTFLRGEERTLKIDTTEYENGLYKIGVAAQSDGNSPPIAYATAQLIIEN